jgi:hypothetical protein
MNSMTIRAFAYRGLLLVASMIIALHSVAFSQERPNANVLALGEFASPYSQDKGSAVFLRVTGALNEAMIARGLKVFDETAVTMKFTDPGRKRRNDAYLIDVARSISEPPVDAILIFDIMIERRLIRASRLKEREPRLRISARILGVRDGRNFGQSEIEPESPLPAIANDCRGNCVGEAVGDAARLLALRLGDRLADTLLAELKRP